MATNALLSEDVAIVRINEHCLSQAACFTGSHPCPGAFASSFQSTVGFVFVLCAALLKFLKNVLARFCKLLGSL